jgi:GGDEF domain-containing protein
VGACSKNGFLAALLQSNKLSACLKNCKKALHRLFIYRIAGDTFNTILSRKAAEARKDLACEIFKTILNNSFKDVIKHRTSLV